MYWDPPVFQTLTRKERYVLKVSLLLSNYWKNIRVGDISLALLKNTEFD